MLIFRAMQKILTDNFTGILDDFGLEKIPQIQGFFPEFVGLIFNIYSI